MAILKVHGASVEVPDALLAEYERCYGTGEVSDVESVLCELVKEDSSNVKRDTERKLEWAVRQASGVTTEEARKRLEEMIKDGDDYGIC